MITNRTVLAGKLESAYDVAILAKRAAAKNPDESTLVETLAITYETLKAHLVLFLDETRGAPLDRSDERLLEMIRMSFVSEYITVPAKCFSCQASIPHQNGAGWLTGGWITGCRKCNRSFCD